MYLSIINTLTLKNHKQIEVQMAENRNLLTKENCQFYLVKRRLRGGGGGQKSPILRRHSLWTAPLMNG